MIRLAKKSMLSSGMEEHLLFHNHAIYPPQTESVNLVESIYPTVTLPFYNNLREEVSKYVSAIERYHLSADIRIPLLGVNRVDVACFPIHIAASCGDSASVMRLITLKGSLNVVDSHGLTELTHAAINGHTNTCEVLLRSGTQLCQTLADGTVTSQALVLAILRGQKTAAKYLSEEGACVSPSDPILHRISNFGSDIERCALRTVFSSVYPLSSATPCKASVITPTHLINRSPSSQASSQASSSTGSLSSARWRSMHTTSVRRTSTPVIQAGAHPIPVDTNDSDCSPRSATPLSDSASSRCLSPASADGPPTVGRASPEPFYLYSTLNENDVHTPRVPWFVYRGGASVFADGSGV